MGEEKTKEQVHESSLDLEKDINWEIFTPEEKEALINCYEEGDLDNIAALPDVMITPLKELEIEKLVLDLREIDLEDESEVQGELEKFWGEGGEMTPDKEAEFQEKLDAEKEAKKKQIEDRKNQVDDEIKERTGEPELYTLTEEDFEKHSELESMGFKVGDEIDKSKKLGEQIPERTSDNE